MKKLAVLFAMFAIVSLTACTHNAAPEAATEEHQAVEVEVVTHDDGDVVETTVTTETTETVVVVEDEAASDVDAK